MRELLENPPRAVIFDLDGLLFNTEALRMRALDSCAADLGRELPRQLFLDLIGGADASARAALENYLQNEAPPDFWMLWRRRVDALFAAELAPKPGVVELLDDLDRTRTPRAIATSARRSSVEEYCGRFGLGDRFHAIIAQGDYERPKPAPDAFLAAAAALGAAARDCLALEDSYQGVRAARAADMRVIMVPEVLPPTMEMRGACVLIAADLHEARAALRGENSSKTLRPKPGRFS